jgi:hypothetical protein
MISAETIAALEQRGLLYNHLYRAMAWLGEELPADQQDGATRFAPRCSKDLIEEHLFAHRRDLFSRLDLVFMDTTSLYFEGLGGQSIGQYGYSKDHRPDLRQMILAVLIDGEGRPVCSEIWPGNTADVTSLVPVIERLRRRFAIGRVCIVADRGMISAETIAALEAEGVEYILGVRERSSREVREHVIDDEGVAVPLIIPRQKGETQLAVHERTVAGRRYVICRNEEEARKDAEARAELIAGLERKLAKDDKALVGNTGFRRFLKTPEHDTFVIDHAKVKADARFDGLFVLRTNTSLSALQVVLRYRNLLAVETAFKTAKACSPPGQSSTRQMPASAAMSSVHFLLSFCVPNLCIVSRPAVARTWNGSTSSTTLPISVKSTSSRTAAAPACAPPQARPSIRSAGLSASPCHRSSRRCPPPLEPIGTCGA